MENILIGNSENLESLISSDKLSVVDFWAKWCNPCKTQLPILSEFSKLNTDVQIIKVNVDENKDLTQSYGIKNIPTMIFFKKGEEKKRTVGVQKINDLNKLKEELA